MVSVLFILSLSSCYSTKKYAYLQDLSADTSINKVVIKQADFLLKIQPDDIIGIDVLSSNPAAAAPFNINNITSIGGYNNNGMDAQPLKSSPPSSSINIGNAQGGYLVDRDGYINFPVIGQMKVAGLTLMYFRDSLISILRNKYITDATVNVKLLNGGALVYGEVSAPSRIGLTREKTSIYDALVLAGDMTPIAKRKDILLVRENNGIKYVHHLDMTNSKIINSEFYYLKQNDMVYVPPTKEKALINDNTTFRITNYLFTAISLISLIIAVSK
ncbi:polysaccharide biosynthesis/export family protein [Rhizosphaericola mali]|uniref:Polysaccharide export protein N-terminal domain-containing protein n=1 Tax=Rhizosphaericola mali TaxID=2545455 RepID=A0A5P2G3A7_9BACT|nr:polysaccharide biosynthesis/export family protein [Rhizosphaericola mali]QES89208.1 hypothetical protein E0W69_011220 [Rhizosphaericola mali]